jgi:phosphoenolpyruvate carboxykinase (ATP)
MTEFDLTRYGITVSDVRRNLVPATLYQEALRTEKDSVIASSGALIAYSHEKTGRSPRDKHVVEHPDSAGEVWWGPVNVPIPESTFAVNRERATDYLNTRELLYVVDAFAGWDPEYRLKVRVVCTRPYHALFMHTMLIRPTGEEFASFGEPDVVIFNAGQFPANRRTTGMTSKTSVDVNLESRELVILGTEYAGEMKKGVLTLMNYFMPRRGVLSMHCSATEDRNTGTSSILFGLSGTGKTTLSADPRRYLIGDDEHCWTERGIFNIEGGCYAKAMALSPELEPDIYRAIRFGSVLENVTYDAATHEVNFSDHSITENTRGAYPIEYIDNARIPCVSGHPRDVIFLTCDAFGVLPPVSRLTPAQAMYHFISGYTARVAGTEMGVTEPQATFSPCFGGPFLVWHPGKYADLLRERIETHKSNVWLVNTGWSGGAYGTGQRMKLAFTRSIVDAIHTGALEDAPLVEDPFFGFGVVSRCPNVPDEVLLPRKAWADPAAYDQTARKLAALFQQNFTSYEDRVSAAVRSAGARL